jgi:cytochrome c oxidase assembly protein subunit 15
VGVVAAVLFLGTVVTGTGPHSGDKNASHRLPFNLADVTHAHADLVFVLLGLLVGLIVALRATGAPAPVVRRAVVLLGVALAQGLVGFTQYLTDLPVALVGVHVLGAALVWIASLRLLLATTQRVAVDSASTGADRSLAVSRT